VGDAENARHGNEVGYPIAGHETKDTRIDMLVLVSLTKLQDMKLQDITEQ